MTSVGLVLAAGRARGRFPSVISIRARVRNGRLIVDEPCDLPDGAEVEVTIVEVDEERRFNAAVDAGLEDIAAGRVLEHDDVKRRLEAKFGRFPQ